VHLVEVVDGVARLVDDVGPGDPQLVALPQQVDELLQAPTHAALGRGVRRAIGLVEQRGDPPQLDQDRAPRRLGGVRGEHRAHREVLDVGGQLAGADARCGDAVDRLRQPGAALGAGRGQLARAVGLLGDIGQVEVGRERPDQAGGGQRVGRGDDRRGLVAVGAHELAHALDEVEHLASLLAHERLPEQHAQLADVAAQRGMRVVADGGGLLGEHRCRAW
jgi:hypothetical protein